MFDKFREELFKCIAGAHGRRPLPPVDRGSVVCGGMNRCVAGIICAADTAIHVSRVQTIGCRP